MYQDRDDRSAKDRIADRCGIPRNVEDDAALAAAWTLIQELDRKPQGLPWPITVRPTPFVFPHQPSTGDPPPVPGFQVWCGPEHGGQ